MKRRTRASRDKVRLGAVSASLKERRSLAQVAAADGTINSIEALDSRKKAEADKEERGYLNDSHLKVFKECFLIVGKERYVGK